jgi:hypothetical protein
MSKNNPGFVELPFHPEEGMVLVHPDEIRSVRFIVCPPTDETPTTTIMGVNDRFIYALDATQPAEEQRIRLSCRVVAARQELHALAHGWDGDPESSDPMNPHRKLRT